MRPPVPRDMNGPSLALDARAAPSTHPGRVATPSELEVQPEGVVEFGQRLGCEPSDHPTQALDGEGAHLLGLRLRVTSEAGRRRGEERLERVDPVDVAG